MKSKHVRPGLEKRALVVRLRRIKGQVEAIEKMVEADADCSDAHGHSRIVAAIHSETKADNAAAKLKAMISVTATVVRNGQIREIPLREEYAFRETNEGCNQVLFVVGYFDSISRCG